MKVRFINQIYKRLQSQYILLLLLLPTFIVAQTYEIDTYNGQTITTCTGNFYDSGGAIGNYSNDEDYTITFTSDNGGDVQLNFTSFNVETEPSCNYDYMRIYDGTSTSDPLIGEYCGTTSPGTIESTGGSLHIVWHSDISIVRAGWAASISCTSGGAPDHSGTLLYDHFGVELELLAPHSGGSNYSFDWNSFVPTLNTGTANFTESDWYGNWNFSAFGDGSNTIQHTPAPGTADLDYYPSGDEPYDVEAVYFDDDATNLYVVIVTSVAHYVAANNDVGVVDPRISSTAALVRPGDLSINLFEGSPRIERNSTEWYYNFGVNITHENRDNIISVGGYDTRAMRDNNVGNELYRTGYDAGGSNNLNPADSDWYTSLIDGVVEANWEHTNFDPQSTIQTADLSYLGNAVVDYYEYDFGGGLKENGYPTYVYEFTIPRSLLGMSDPCVGDPVGIQWIEGCRNDGNDTAAAISLTGTADECNYASIGDYVWEDLDQDGIQDGGETGLENVQVYLYDDVGTEIDNTTTNATGYYSFTNIVPGDYYLTFIPLVNYDISPQDQGGDDNLDSDADQSTGETTITTLEPNEDDISWDAGMYQPVATATLGDYVWNDIDQDGNQDGGETGLENVTVNLFYDGGGSAGSTTTDTNGNYIFTNIVPGHYYLEFILPNGYTFSPKDASGNFSDSDADEVTGQTDIITLSAGQNDNRWDAGMYYSGSCANNLLSNPGFEDDFTDWSTNGSASITNDAQLGLKAVELTGGSGTDVIQIIPAAEGKRYSLTVYAKKTLGDYADVGWYFLDSGGGELQDVPIAITSIGSYQFYTIEATAPVGTVSIRAYAWPGNNASNVITVDEYCLTEVPLGALGDYVWLDTNLDGLQNDGSTGIESVRLILLDGTSTQIDETYTDANGWYQFTDLPADNYTILVDDVTLPEEIDVQTYDYDGISSPHNAHVTLSEGETNLDLDFGYGISTLPVTLSGFMGQIEGNKIKLSWITQSEVQNQGFFVERRLDSEEEWIELTNFLENPGLRGQGSSTYKAEYEYIDSTALSGFIYEYRLGDVDYNTAKYFHNNRIIRIEVEYAAIPEKFSLQPAHPNPFNPITTISYSLPEVCHTQLNIYDISGNLVRKLVNRVENPGTKDVIWDSRNEKGEEVPSGMYIYTLRAGNFKESNKLLLIR